MQKIPFVQTILTAFSILDVIAGSDGAMSITEIGEKLGLHKSTVLRQLTTLEHLNCVRRDQGTMRYQLGLELFRLGSVIIDKIDVRTIARPTGELLSECTGEVVHLGVLDKDMVVYIDKIESSQPIQIRSRVGRTAPAYCTGIGKALLAHSPTQMIERYLENVHFEAFTANTITTKEELSKELEDIRVLGYAVDREEHEEGIQCIAAPIFNHTGYAIAAVSITFPTMRINKKSFRIFSDLIVKAGHETSLKMGCEVGNCCGAGSEEGW